MRGDSILCAYARCVHQSAVGENSFACPFTPLPFAAQCGGSSHKEASLWDSNEVGGKGAAALGGGEGAGCGVQRLNLEEQYRLKEPNNKRKGGC